MKIYLLLLFIFTFLLYGNTIKHDYVLDDDIVTRGNKFVQQGVGAFPLSLKRGITMASMVITKGHIVRWFQSILQ